MENLQGGMLALEHRYSVDAEVGRQGLATIYRGTQHPFDRSVTIRVFDAFEMASQPEGLVSTIKKAAQRAAVLEHEGVLRVVDYGELTAEVPFVVSERVTGPTLAMFLEQSGTLTLEEVVSLIERLAPILDEAHTRGVVHGHLSPYAVTLPQKDVQRAVVGQFGLMIPMSEVRKIDGAMLSFPLVAGLAPEMFGEGALPSRAGDIHALGALAYMALSGQHPYFDDINDTSEGLIAIQNGEPRDLREFGVSAAIWEAIRPALSRNPDERPEHALEFSTALRKAAFPAPRVEVKATDVLVEDDADEHDDDSSDAPTPGAVAWGVLLLVLILTNVGWFVWVGKQTASPAVNVVATATSAGVLGQGVDLDSMPTGAKVTLLGAGAGELGETPVAVSPTIAQDGAAVLRVEKHGYEPLEVEVTKTSAGNRLVLRLKEAVASPK